MMKPERTVLIEKEDKEDLEMVNKYRKKPVVVEAIQFINDEADTLEAIKNFLTNQDLRVSYRNPDCPVIKIETLEGVMEASVGDYIIKGVSGEFYPCKPDIFKMTYDLVE